VAVLATMGVLAAMVVLRSQRLSIVIMKMTR
jgi:hypothetical protein